MIENIKEERGTPRRKGAVEKKGKHLQRKGAAGKKGDVLENWGHLKRNLDKVNVW